MKRNKGITLVSLVVTIIVLIILAGVSINLTLGENGIITISKQAKENIELAKVEEEIKLNELYTQIELEGGVSGEISYDAIAKLAEFKKAIADYIEEAGGIKPEYTSDTVTFGESIKGIVKEVTKDATATAEDITEGKTAWVNGNKITGTALDYNNNPKLLWQNSYSASSATFPAQTVNLDLSNYDAIILSLIRVHTSTTRWYFVIPIGTSQVVNMYMNGDATNIGGNTWYRLITTSENSIIFGNPLNDSSCNYGMLPCEIYGLSNLF